MSAMKDVIDFLLWVDPTVIYLVGILAIVASLMISVHTTQPHDKKDYPNEHK